MHQSTNLFVILSDEEEKDVDDWDVDMNEYYERGSGDKDAQDFVQMRRHMRQEQGLDSDDEDLSAVGIGKFERHTKVILECKEGFVYVRIFLQLLVFEFSGT